VLHLRKVRKSNKLFKSVILRICDLRNLFADRPPLLSTRNINFLTFLRKSWSLQSRSLCWVVSLKHTVPSWILVFFYLCILVFLYSCILVFLYSCILVFLYSCILVFLYSLVIWFCRYRYIFCVLDDRKIHLYTDPDLGY
jgi:hypothetical protein